MYVDQVKTFTAYQTRVALRAIRQHSDADLVMIYIEQPDGSGHQFTLTDPRQATNFLDPASIGKPANPPGASGQDQRKIARCERYLKIAYRAANDAVHAIIDAAGIGPDGTPASDVFVVSDHGMAPFHTAVNLRNLLVNAGIDPNLIGIRTTGPAAHVYVNLQGREAGGSVSSADYQALVTRIAAALRDARDPNPIFNYSLADERIFTQVAARPFSCNAGVGLCTSTEIGQDSGDVFAIMAEGYNFDGTQSPGVARLGDPAYSTETTVFSVPNFYGAHGHDSDLPSMSASFYAAGPGIRHGVSVPVMRNIDVVPTILHLLGVTPAGRVDGSVLGEILRKED
jgi:predicted AlkP superfamily pyrophosphatase or phosphodiesterase